MPLLLCHYKITILSRTLKDLRVLPYLQAKRLASCSYWFLAKDMRPLGQTQITLLHISAGSVNYVFALFSLVL